MIIHDLVGQPLEEGDQVALPIGFGIQGVGQVVAVTSGLVNPAAPNQQTAPSVVVVINITVPAQPTGKVSITKIASKERSLA